MGMKEAYQQKLEAQLDEWTADINKMKAKADKADADAWEDLKAGMENAWNSLGNAMKSATSRFK